MITDPELLKSLMQQGSLMPKEEMLEVPRKKGALFIGIPKETSFQEKRVALVPEAVGLLVANGHRVRIEAKAGEGANFTDNEYSEAGAEICLDRQEIYKCDIICKVALAARVHSTVTIFPRFRVETLIAISFYFFFQFKITKLVFWNAEPNLESN